MITPQQKAYLDSLSDDDVKKLVQTHLQAPSQDILPQEKGILPQPIQGALQGLFRTHLAQQGISPDKITGEGDLDTYYKKAVINNQLREQTQLEKENRTTGQMVPVYGYDEKGKYGPLIDDSGNPITQPKTAKTASMGFGVMNAKVAQEAVPGIEKSLAAGQGAGYQNAMPMAKTIIAGRAGDKGFNLDEPVLGFKGEQNLVGNTKIADAKVNMAIQLKDMIDSNTDAQGNIKLPPNMHTELALGVARMLTPTGVVPIELEQQLRQGTLRERAANLAIYMGADPKEVGGTTQSVAQFFKHTIERLGSQSQMQRESLIQGA